jgi:N-acetylglucosamine-6-phosphate deacetylase
MMTATPAKIMGVSDRKGSILPGKDADLVLFDDRIDIHLTMVGGRIVYTRKAGG